MKQRIPPYEALLAPLVLIHLGVSVIHGFVHSRASVELSPASMLFVFAVILVGPVLGLVVQRLSLPRVGAWLIAVTLAGSLAFGLANHFLIQGADHVRHVPEPWRVSFAVTAALLVVTEALGAAMAMWFASNVRRAS